MIHTGLELKDLFQDLRFPDTRDHSLARILECFDEWIQFCGPPKDGVELEDEASRLFTATIPTILNLSLSCPHKHVREVMASLCAKLRAAGRKVPEPVYRGVSHFISEAKIIPLDTDGDAREELREAFDSDGRLTHMTRLMAYHPRYLKTFRKSIIHIMWGDGPLSIPIRQLLAVMGASRHSCAYLVNIYSANFIDAGGDPKWLDGPHVLPPKLRNICDLSAILAHKPWVLTADHISRLVKPISPAEAWSLPELLQACLILSRFQTLTGFIFGMGCIEEADIRNSSTNVASAQSSAAPSRASSSPVKGLADRLEPLEIAPPTPSSDACSTRALLANLQQLQQHPPAKPIAQPVARKESVSVPAAKALSALTTGFEPSGAESASFYTDFSETEFPTFCFQTFSWQDEAFATLARYNETMAELMTDEFQTIKELTYETMGDATEVDTVKFRWALWNYVFSLYGVTDREYLYAEVDVLVRGLLRDWVKIIATTPQRAERDRRLYDTFTDLRDSEKAHMCLLVIEARHMAAMLYLLYAISSYTDR